MIGPSGTPEPSRVAADVRERRSLTAVTLTASIAIDLCMKTLVTAGYVASFEHGSGHSALESASRAVRIGAPIFVVWVALVFAKARGIERTLTPLANGEATMARIRGANAAIRSLPLALSLRWVAGFLTYFTLLVFSSDHPPSLTAAVFFLATMLTGPALVGHSLGVWVTAPKVQAVSLLARERGIAIHASPMRLRAMLTVYSLFLGLAPYTYTAAIAVCGRTSMLPFETLITSILVFLFAVVAYTCISAYLMSSTLTEPLAAMATVMKTIVRRGAVARVGRVPFFHRDEVGAVADLTNEMLDRLDEAESERRTATTSLEVLNQNLEQRVSDRTNELSARTASMRLVLDNVNEGLFVVDGSGAIGGEHSAVLASWFGDPPRGERFHHYFAPVSRAFADEAEAAWSQLEEDFLPIEVAVEQLPRRLVAGVRHFELSYQPLGARARDGVLVVVTDVTSRVASETAEREKKEAFALFQHVASDRAGVVGFLGEGSTYVETIRRGLSRPDVKRALHTLKGNALIFGQETIGLDCHELESELEAGGEPCPSRVAALAARWARLVEDADVWFGTRRGAIEISPEQYDAVARVARKIAGGDALVAMIEQLRLEPAERRLVHFADQARRIAERLEKKVDVDVVGDGVRLDPPRFAKIWGAFVHAVRNAVDHGLEHEAEREAAGKAARGRIVLSATTDGTDVTVAISDDGRGISWARVREKAVALGLPSTTDRDLVEALFAEGLSTADEVSDLSGRGVGMGALRAEVRAAGGTLDIESVPGKGTTLRFRVPLEAPPSLARPSLRLSA